MKHVLLVTALGTLSLLAGCSTPTPSMDHADSRGNTATYEVYGMDCPGCHGGLEKNLEKIPGVLKADANWKQQRVTLSMDETTAVSAEQITQAVNDSNFTLGKKIM